MVYTSFDFWAFKNAVFFRFFVKRFDPGGLLQWLMVEWKNCLYFRGFLPPFPLPVMWPSAGWEKQEVWILTHLEAWCDTMPWSKFILTWRFWILMVSLTLLLCQWISLFVILALSQTIEWLVLRSWLEKTKTPTITYEGWNSQKRLSYPVEKKIEEGKRRKKRLLYPHPKALFRFSSPKGSFTE